MMKRQWRFLFAALAIAVSLSMVLTGCVTTAPTAATTGEPTKDAATAAPTTAAAEPTVNPDIKDFKTITWYQWCNAGDQPDKDAVMKAINEYLKPLINAEVDLKVIQSGDYDNKMNPMLASGEKFDLLFSTSWAANYRVNATGGFLLQLNDLLPKWAPDVEKVLGTDFLYASAIDGKLYTMATGKEKAHAWGPVMRKDLVDKYKIDMTNIKSYKDFEPVLKQIKEGEPGMWPLLVVVGEAPFRNLDWDNIGDDKCPGALYSNNDASNTKVINQFIAPEAVEHYKLMRDFYTKGYINPDAPTQTNFGDEFRSGKYFAVDQSLKPNKYVEMSGSFSIPVVQAQFTPAIMSNRETTGSMLAIPKASENPERTLMFVNLLYTDSNLVNLIQFGIKDEHYVMVGDKQYKDGPKNLTKPAGYKPGFTWCFGNQYAQLISEQDSPTVWDAYKEFDKSALPLKSLGFIYDGKNVQNEIAACINVREKYYVNLFTGAGTEPVDTIVANMTAEFKTAGADLVLADMQTQYDAFLASKK
jgi:putative aldouronate transport system substrate-binding protein